MYPRRISQKVVLTKPNLKTFFSEQSVISSKPHLIIEKLSLSNTFNNLRHVKERIDTILRDVKLYRTLQYNLQAIPRNLRDQSSNMLRVWTHQFECVLAQRLRRGQQMFCLYSRLWEDRAFKELLKRFRHQLSRKGKELVLASVGIAAFNWEENRIPDDIIENHLDAFDYAYLLKAKTICNACPQGSAEGKGAKQTGKGAKQTGKRAKKTGICQCKTAGDLSDYNTYDDWEPFIEENDLIVWRRSRGPGLFEYKAYGSYDDVNALDFLNVQIDTTYRRTWDATAVVLEVVETDPVTESHNDVIYWEMLWPRIFSNRDYVFTRKYIVDQERNTILIVSKSTQHPAYPKISNKHRIENYWSYMVIRPQKNMNEKGIEFVLTYFDNPGVNIPGSVTTWVAYRAMPDFLQRLRTATKEYKEYCRAEGVSVFCKMPYNEKTHEEIETDSDLPFCDEDIVTDNTISEAQHTVKPPCPDEREPKPKLCREHRVSKNDYMSPEDILTSPSPITQADNCGYWKYLQPMYYFS